MNKPNVLVVGNDPVLVEAVESLGDHLEVLVIDNVKAEIETAAANAYHANILLIDLKHWFAHILIGLWAGWQVAEQAFEQGIVHGPLVGVTDSYGEEDHVRTMVPKIFSSVEEAVSWINLESSTWTTGAKRADGPSSNSPEDSGDTATQEFKVLGSDGQPLK